jgi:hypothetical protein
VNISHVFVDISSTQTSVWLAKDRFQVGNALIAMSGFASPVSIAVHDSSLLALGSDDYIPFAFGVSVSFRSSLTIQTSLAGGTFFISRDSILDFRTPTFSGTLLFDSGEGVVDVNCGFPLWQFGSRFVTFGNDTIIRLWQNESLDRQAVRVQTLETFGSVCFYTTKSLTLASSDLRIGGPLGLGTGVDLVCDGPLTLNMVPDACEAPISRLTLPRPVKLTIVYARGAGPFVIDQLNGTFERVLTLDFDGAIGSDVAPYSGVDLMLLMHTNISLGASFVSGDSLSEVVNANLVAIVARVNAIEYLRRKGTVCIINDAPELCAHYSAVLALRGSAFSGSDTFCTFRKPTFVVTQDLTMSIQNFTGLLADTCESRPSARVQEKPVLHYEGTRTTMSVQVSAPVPDALVLEIA